MTGGAEYLRAADIVRLTGVSIRTVRRWIADEIIPSTKLGGARLVASLGACSHPYPPPPRKTRRMTITSYENQAILALS
jgi:hypothetical protein